MDSVEHVDALVVGSGFGGSVSCLRLAEAGLSVVLMERGRAFPPGSFPRDPSGMAHNLWDPGNGTFGMFDIRSFEGLDAVVSSGLGGGSLIYANVLLRKDENWFVHEEPIPGGGYEDWPVTRADLDPHYDRVEAMMTAQTYPYADTTAKTSAYRDAAARAGLAWELPPLAVSFRASPGASPMPGAPIPVPEYGNIHGLPRRTCVLCGECDLGCNDGAKNTLDHTYLSAAQHRGADIRTGHEVRGIAPRAEGGFTVRYVKHDLAGSGAGAAEAGRIICTITCDRLVLAAGTLGTTLLLLANRAAFPGLSPALGTRFSGNGDLLGFVHDAVDESGRPRALHGSRGPVITSAVRVPDAHDDPSGDPGWPRPRGHYVQDAGYPALAEWLVELSHTAAVAGRGARFSEARLAASLRGSRRTAISRDVGRLLGPGASAGATLPVLGMGRDVPDGVMSLRGGELAVDWTPVTSRAYIEGVRTTMSALAAALGGNFTDDPLWLLRRVITVHPLGGAPMGRDPSRGVCDNRGEVFGYPGLFIADGSAVPGAVGPNPSLTIAALADRMCDHLLESPPVARRESVPAPARSSMADPAAPADPPPGASTDGPATSLAFTEQMKGWAGWGETSPATGAAVGRSRGQRLSFRLTIGTADVERFVSDPEHEGVANGTVTYEPLGGRRPVERGWFNLFTIPEDPTRRSMRYRLHFSDPGGNPATFVGVKDVHDDRGADVWADTTTLRVIIVPGHVDEPTAATLTPLAAGVITIAPQDFARQLTTFRAHGPHASRGLAAFGQLFMGQLWVVYGGRAAALVDRKGRRARVDATPPVSTDASTEEMADGGPR